MLQITANIVIAEWELEFSAIRAQGAGGQNVNKVSSAIHLRFDIQRSSLPAFYKERLLAYSDSRISKEGVVIIKAQQYRDQAKNKQDSLERLRLLISEATKVEKVRRNTKPTRNSQKRRMDKKTQKSHTKALRGAIRF
ncbi:ribosome-associated protein [Pseudoalteromonas ulvae UL12]|uniref:alternative ribosome rescue aminoacyl-tRNA hydrolase ArfB n=1 Tax=Pseudoalteromonas ulvae TaxID=107327 RepID=UPI00186B66D7|nr:alternative ribosome rescue aminoacyl-tRNA hydrolase ArfB [Pseudoalteromonas ulvae]MBE0365907.1 ribosome-associated protein [Pseudoalteromonas ulvae UL12]